MVYVSRVSTSLRGCVVYIIYIHTYVRERSGAACTRRMRCNIYIYHWQHCDKCVRVRTYVCARTYHTRMHACMHAYMYVCTAEILKYSKNAAGNSCKPDRRSDVLGVCSMQVYVRIYTRFTIFVNSMSRSGSADIYQARRRSSQSSQGAICHIAHGNLYLLPCVAEQSPSNVNVNVYRSPPIA